MNILSAKSVGILSALGALALVGVVARSSHATAQRSTVQGVAYTEDGHPYIKGELLLKVRSQAALERFVSGNRGTLGAFSERVAVHTSRSGNWFKVKTDGDVSLNTAIQRALQSDGVLLAEPNYIYSINLGPKPPATPKPTPTQPPSTPTAGPSVTPTPVSAGPDYNKVPALPMPPVADPDVSKTWAMAKIGAQAAWNITPGSSKVIVADIDTGADYNHPDLVNNIWRNPGESGAKANNGIDDDGNGIIDDAIGYDFRDKDSRPYDDNNHGSHTAGTIGAVGGNGLGISGVAQKVSIMVLRFLGGSRGSGSSEDAIACVNYAAANGAQIMSASWGNGPYSQALMDAIRAAGEKEILFVAAAGNATNDNDAKPTYPASYQLPNILSVAATDQNDALASFSNFGVKSVHLAAPGVNIYSTIPGGQYKTYNGTSMAAPHVSGAAALLKAAYPSLKATELKALLVDSVDTLPALATKTISGGRLNLARAFELAQERFGAPAGE